MEMPIIDGAQGACMDNTGMDPVCGMDIEPDTAAGKSEYKGQTYYFCSPGCKRSFDKDPEKYLITDAQASHHHSLAPSPFENGLSVQPGQAIRLICGQAGSFSSARAGAHTLG